MVCKHCGGAQLLASENWWVEQRRKLFTEFGFRRNRSCHSCDSERALLMLKKLCSLSRIYVKFLFIHNCMLRENWEKRFLNSLVSDTWTKKNSRNIVLDGLSRKSSSFCYRTTKMLEFLYKLWPAALVKKWWTSRKKRHSNFLWTTVWINILNLIVFTIINSHFNPWFSNL